MAKKPTKSTKTKPTKAPAQPAKVKRVQRVYKERYPDHHDITGKYVFLYMFFAFCTLIFALTTIYLFSTAHDIIRRYDSFIRTTQENNVTQKENTNE